MNGGDDLRAPGRNSLLKNSKIREKLKGVD